MIAPGLHNCRSVAVADAHDIPEAKLLSADQLLIRTRPFWAPHRTISHAGLVDDGTWPRPGETSLAHRGILLLDELVEMGGKNLEALRPPPEDQMLPSHGQASLSFPADFVLVAAVY